MDPMFWVMDDGLADRQDQSVCNVFPHEVPHRLRELLPTLEEMRKLVDECGYSHATDLCIDAACALSLPIWHR